MVIRRNISSFTHTIISFFRNLYLISGIFHFYIHLFNYYSIIIHQYMDFCINPPNYIYFKQFIKYTIYIITILPSTTCTINDLYIFLKKLDSAQIPEAISNTFQAIIKINKKPPKKSNLFTFSLCSLLLVDFELFPLIYILNI